MRSNRTARSSSPEIENTKLFSHDVGECTRNGFSRSQI
jgi:hypothetical protein